MSFLKFFRKQKTPSHKEAASVNVYKLDRDGGEPLEFRGRKIAEIAWPWIENHYANTTVICRLQIFETDAGTWIAGQSRYNLQVMILGPRSAPDDIFYEAREFDELQEALDWLESGRLGQVTVYSCLAHAAKTGRQFVFDRLLHL